MTIKKYLNTLVKSNTVKTDGNWTLVTIKPTLSEISKNRFLTNEEVIKEKILNLDGVVFNTYMSDDYRDENQYSCLRVDVVLPPIFENLTSYAWLEANKDLFKGNELVTIYCDLWNRPYDKKIHTIFQNFSILTDLLNTYDTIK
jgi:hypothetical protein